MRWYFLLLLVLIFLPAVNALRFYDIECFDDGHAEITFAADLDDQKIYTDSISINMDGTKLSGFWEGKHIKASDTAKSRYDTFTTPSASINKEGMHTFIATFTESGVNRSISDAASCPGLFFTCDLLGVDIVKCGMDNDSLIADLNISGLNQGVILHPSDVVDITINAVSNFKSVEGAFSKSGSITQGSIFTTYPNGITKLTVPLPDNSVESMIILLKDNLPKSCHPSVYPNVKFDDFAYCDKSYFITKITAGSETVEPTKVDAVIDNFKQLEREATPLKSQQKSVLLGGEIHGKSIFITTIVIIIVVILFIIIGILLKRKYRSNFE